MRLKGSKDFEFTDYFEFETEIHVTGYTPARQAHYTSNPDSMWFGDSGDPSEWDEVKMFFHIKKERFNNKTEKKEVVKELIVPVPQEIINFLLEHGNLEETIETEGNKFWEDEYPERSYDEDYGKER